MRRAWLWIILLSLLPSLSFLGPFAATPGPDPADAAPGHSGGVIQVVGALVLFLLGAKLFGEIFLRMKQTPVLGELLFGVLLGSLPLFGFEGLAHLTQNEGLLTLAELGVILLLFEVGLDSDIKEMREVGASSLLVAVLGVIGPFGLGWLCSWWLLTDVDPLVHVFVGATLSATSVGITARVLDDLKRIQSQEARIILGAAVLDDVLGLVILAVVQSAITASHAGTSLDLLGILWIVVKAVLFLVLAVTVGGHLPRLVFQLARRLEVRGLLLSVSLAFCFLFAYVASLLELAPIVGAFAAGLVLDEVKIKRDYYHEEFGLEDLVVPISSFLVPVFFVLMGMRVDLSTFGHTQVLGVALALTVAAVAGKMLCAVGVREREVDRISVAVGMVPRGEVGLIFASVGASLTLHGEPVINPSLLSAVVIMVIVTTLITPPLLKWTLGRGSGSSVQPGEEGEGLAGS